MIVQHPFFIERQALRWGRSRERRERGERFELKVLSVESGQLLTVSFAAASCLLPSAFFKNHLLDRSAPKRRSSIQPLYAKIFIGI